MAGADNELLERAGAGDINALRLLLKRHGSQVHNAIRGRIGKPWRVVLDEDDVMQVTFLEAFLHIEQLEARDPAGLSAWLMRIAENVLRDAIKELGRKKRPAAVCRVHAPSREDSYITLIETLGRTSTTPSQRVGRHEAVGILDRLIQKLPQDYRRVVELADLQGRSLAEVAEAMGRSMRAAHILQARAHQRLRELMGPASLYCTI